MTNPCFLVIFTVDNSSLNEPELQEQVEKLNRQNAEHSHLNTEADGQKGEDAGSGERRQELAELILPEPHTSAAQSEERQKEATQREGGEDEGDVFDDTEPEEEEQQADDVGTGQSGKLEDGMNERHKEETGESSETEKAKDAISEISLLPQERYFSKHSQHNCH